MDTDAKPSRGWIAIALVVWLFAGLANIAAHRADIAALAMPDTDDAQRLVEVRDWLDGQAWGDVDQHRMNPPAGANMHWSRLIDLPIAAMIVATEPIAGRAAAERFAATLAPLLALLFAMLMAGVAADRLAGRQAAIFAVLFFAACSPLIPLFSPLRIDHHNWQIALLVGVVAMLADPRARFRSGVFAAIAAAAALMIGLEMLPHMVVASVALVAAWCLRPSLGRLLAGYGVSLGVATLAMYPAFVPTARWGLAVCDAMSPVYLATLVPAGIVAAALPNLAVLNTAARRFLAAAIGFGLIGLSAIIVFPQCATGPMGALDPTFLPVLARISEARPLLSYLNDKPATIVFFGLYPFVGLACAAYMLRGAETAQRFGWWLVLAVLVAATALMFVQLRAVTGGNAVATIAAASAAAKLLPMARTISAVLPRVLATAGLLAALTSALPTFAALGIARATGSDETDAADQLRPSCTAAATLAPVARLPRGVIANVFDMGPALLVHTPHAVMAGPYHRTPSMITDSVRLWRVGDAEARVIAARYGSTYLLGCTSAYDLDAARLDAPGGLWGRLDAGKAPGWLEPLPLPAGSPLRLYRIIG